MPTFRHDFILATTLILAAYAQGSGPVCTICKSGGEVENPNGLITTSHGQTTTCGTLKDYVKLLPTDACMELQSIANKSCGCSATELDMTLSRSEQQYESDSFLSSMSQIGLNYATYDKTGGGGMFDDSYDIDTECSICAEGEMGNPNGYALGATGQPVTCQELHDTRATINSKSACDRVQSMAKLPCGCGSTSGTLSSSSALESLFSGSNAGLSSVMSNFDSNAASFVCPICGTGVMTDPTGIVTNDRGGQKTCAELQANQANIPQNTCSSLQASAIDPCACNFDVDAYAASDYSYDEIVAEEPFYCSICGDGKHMTNLMGTLEVNEGQPKILCGALSDNAHNLSPDTCTNIQSIAYDICGCVASSNDNLTHPDQNGESYSSEELVKCSVCGDGTMSTPDGIVATSQGKSARCDVLQENPKLISQKACANIQGLSRFACGCSYPEPDLDILNGIVPFTCSICDGGEVTIIDGVVTTPEGQAVRCDVLESNANTIPEDACPQIQTIASEPCGCTSLGNSTSVEFNEQVLTRPDVNEDLICHVCGGPAQEIGTPGKMVVTTAGMFTCYSVYSAGLVGAIEMNKCRDVQLVVQKECGCFVDVPTATPSEAPFICSICGNGKVVTQPDGIIDGTNNNSTCSQYETVAAKGELTEDQCLVLQQTSSQACGCHEHPSIPTVSPTSYECKVCGAGRMIGLPDSEITLPNLQKMSCGDVQKRAEVGIIQELQCDQIQPIVSESCGCVQKPEQEIYHCQICGEGLEVTNSAGIVEIPTQPDRSCAQLIDAAAAGHINPVQCNLLHPFVQTPCRCTSDSTYMPTYYPTAPDISMRGDCYYDLKEIQMKERAVQDTSTLRMYTLCPNTIFHMGVWTEDGEVEVGQPFLALRPNVIYQCGVDGNRMNNCVLKGGDFGVASYNEVIEGISEAVPGVEIRGLTFESQNMFSALLKSAGDITFTGCAFKGNTNNAPILIQRESKEAQIGIDRRTSYLDVNETLFDGEYADQVSKQVVTFQDCVFRGNSVHVSASFPGIIENTFDSELILTNCLFEENVYGTVDNPSNVGYAIRSFGPLTLESSCFVRNEFLKYGPVLVYGAQYSAQDNYVKASQTDLSCEFVALFSSKDDIAQNTPTCESSDVNMCGFSQNPTASPTIALLNDYADNLNDVAGSGANPARPALVRLISSTCAVLLIMQCIFCLHV